MKSLLFIMEMLKEYSIPDLIITLITILKSIGRQETIEIIKISESNFDRRKREYLRVPRKNMGKIAKMKKNNVVNTNQNTPQISHGDLIANSVTFM